MQVIRARNVNHALFKGLNLLNDEGTKNPSRNGLVIRHPDPVTTVYARPWERVIWAAQRDANPFFHFLESLWMLAGRNDVKFPATYAKQIAEFSDDGLSLNGAYGYRWRHHFGYDQLKVIINELRANPDSRRCVLQMWDGGTSSTENELYQACNGVKDVCCNTATYFEIQNGKLNMTVTNRSNDVVWGAYGANSVHFSVLQEYMAVAIGVKMGKYYQVSNNYHVYTGRQDVDRLFDGKVVHLADPLTTDRYSDTSHPVLPSQFLFNDVEQVDIELDDFFTKWDRGYFELDDNCKDAISSGAFIEPALVSLAIPMVYIYRVYKQKGAEAAKIALVENMTEIDGSRSDWAIACYEWLERRANKAAQAANETRAA